MDDTYLEPAAEEDYEIYINPVDAWNYFVGNKRELLEKKELIANRYGYGGIYLTATRDRKKPCDINPEIRIFPENHLMWNLIYEFTDTTREEFVKEVSRFYSKYVYGEDHRFTNGEDVYIYEYLGDFLAKNQEQVRKRTRYEKETEFYVGVVKSAKEASELLEKQGVDAKKTRTFIREYWKNVSGS